MIIKLQHSKALENGRAVASDSHDLQFESSHWRTFYLNNCKWNLIKMKIWKWGMSDQLLWVPSLPSTERERATCSQNRLSDFTLHHLAQRFPYSGQCYKTFERKSRNAQKLRNWKNSISEWLKQCDFFKKTGLVLGLRPDFVRFWSFVILLSKIIP